MLARWRALPLVGESTGGRGLAVYVEVPIREVGGWQILVIALVQCLEL